MQQAIIRANIDPYLCQYMVSAGHNELTHWSWDKMAYFLLTIFSNAFPWRILNIFIQIVLKTIGQFGFGIEQAIITWTNDNPGQWRIYQGWF